MNKKLFALLTLSIIGLTCVGEATCMKRQRESEESQQGEQDKRKKEEEENTPPQLMAPKIIKRSYAKGQALRIDVERVDAQNPAPQVYTGKKIKGFTLNKAEDRAASFSFDGTREPFLANIFKFYLPGNVRVFATSQTLEGIELRNAALASYNHHQQALAQRNQQLQQPNTNQEDFQS